MSASIKQIATIHALMEAGAPVPDHPQFDRPDDSMFNSVREADAYINAHRTCYPEVMKRQHALEQQQAAAQSGLVPTGERASMSDWGSAPSC